ncbi:hypothetical protein B0H14DRAFT_2619050 [Mycena olivaceomarginata]|nr:hypothetical protein B0H14DRAFT_2619050 [Mycena olivaceomarginata]
MHGIQNNEKPRDLARLRGAQTDTVESFTQTPARGAEPLTEDHACVTETALEKSSRTPGKEFNGDGKMKSALAEISALTQCTRNTNSGAATTRDEKIYLEMDILGRRMREIEDSSSPGFRDVFFDRGRDSVDVLRKEIRDIVGKGPDQVGVPREEMRNELEVIWDELRSIQTQRRQLRMMRGEGRGGQPEEGFGASRDGGPGIMQLVKAQEKAQEAWNRKIKQCWMETVAKSQPPDYQDSEMRLLSPRVEFNENAVDIEQRKKLD